MELSSERVPSSAQIEPSVPVRLWEIVALATVSPCLHPERIVYGSTRGYPTHLLSHLFLDRLIRTVACTRNSWVQHEFPLSTLRQPYERAKDPELRCSTCREKP